jgi:cysteine desulfurase
MTSAIYLDNNSTTAVDPRVVAVVLESLANGLGNPSSIHRYGQSARQQLEKARQTIADSLSVRPQEVIFTSGGTEGANMLLRGIFPAGCRGHLITSNVEHACVYGNVKALEAVGIGCSILPAGLYGAVQPDAVEGAIRPESKLIALMAVNNETGVKSNIPAIAEIAQENKIPLFVDGVALLGKEPFQIPKGVSAISFSGHKIHAPKGVGFVVMRSHLKLAPLMLGGDQEFGRRPGTENLPAILGMAKAVALLNEELPQATQRMATLRDHFESSLHLQLGGVTVNGSGPRICNTSNLAFAGIEGETLLAALDLAVATASVAASHGSACAAGALQPSRILLNMGLSQEAAASSLRFSLSRFTTREEVDAAIVSIVSAVKRLRF